MVIELQSHRLVDTISKFWIPFIGLARPVPRRGNAPAALVQQEQLTCYRCRTGAGGYCEVFCS
ncbi:hypothetical protein K435DRAFT_231239 [Dendrothele bispora CBS 962.96]|uniref:Uncharacterized protein n=1 Tax=Dendrothele bispora (strain CBS 962.96) TaxID=1314807 RepID=A0A4S8MMW3_DENBC|nr:hypothetical protein K435DRAFT_231239 [Dendrothele bispora CBS 962.96]